MSYRGRFMMVILFAVISFMLTVPNAIAQTVSIDGLAYPEQIFLTKAMSQGAEVTFTVTYSGAQTGYELLFAIYDADAADYARGTISSNPVTCLPATGRYEGSAACSYKLSLSSGVERITAYVKLASLGYSHKLSAAVGLLDTNFNVVTVRLSEPFTILVRDKLSLTIRAPFVVSIMIDGVTQSQGNVFTEVSPGSHVISVPELVEVGNSSRLKFVHWTDGSTQTSRTENLQDDTALEVIYVRQFSLTLISSHVDATGAGWYDEGSTARVSVSASQRMEALLGFLGAKWNFQGWYEGEVLVSTTSDPTITMNGPRHLTAHWGADYTMPISITAVLAIVLGVFAGMLIHRRRRISEHQQIVGDDTTRAYCINCGSGLRQGARFCDECGSAQD